MEREWDTAAENPHPQRSLLDAMAELVLARDSSGRVTEVNAAFLKAFGGARSDWIGRWFAVAPAPSMPGQARRYDAAMRTRAGAAWIEWSETTLDTGGTVAIGRDVSDERRERAEASEAAAGKSVFFASVTHELRTPLSGALGAAALLKDSGLHSDQAAYLEAVRSSAQHALNLIDDILDLSRLEAGRLTLRAEPVDLRSLIEDACEILSTRAVEKGLALAHAISADVPAEIRADPARLRQILFNLGGNAVKFTETGGVLVQADYQEGELSLAFKDTGPGIAKSEQSSLFKHFERGAAEHNATPGAGLGLAMVKRLTEAMDGDVGVSSEPGQGAVFWTRFPAPALAPPPSERPLAGRTIIIASASSIRREALTLKAQALGGDTRETASTYAISDLVPRTDDAATLILDADWADQAPALKTQAPHLRILVLAEPRTKDRFTHKDGPPGIDGWLVSPVRLSSLAAYAQGLEIEPEEPVAPKLPDRALEGLNILVAEDDPVNAMIARTVLTRLGADVAVVDTGRAALEAVAGGQFDAALLDMRMPEMGGLEAAAAIRSLTSPVAALPLIALTANATEDDREACLTAGMDAFLTKPLQPQALIEILTGLCAPQNRASFA
ncbi:response regulator [Oceanicaulis alexandrii]|uniref:response regulator n=1 Tax=Oceanicaulis alexandrii TaxID=153233 RepID=UPI0035D06802